MFCTTDLADTAVSIGKHWFITLPPLCYFDPETSSWLTPWTTAENDLSFSFAFKELESAWKHSKAHSSSERKESQITLLRSNTTHKMTEWHTHQGSSRASFYGVQVFNEAAAADAPVAMISLKYKGEGPSMLLKLIPVIISTLYNGEGIGPSFEKVPWHWMSFKH